MRWPFAVVLCLLLNDVVVVVGEVFWFVLLRLVEAGDVSVAVDLDPVRISQGLKTRLSVGVRLRGLHFASA